MGVSVGGWRSEDHLQELVLFFHPVVSLIVIKLGGKVTSLILGQRSTPHSSHL